jgi:mannosyltransferase
MRLIDLGRASFWVDEAYSQVIIRQPSFSQTFKLLLEDAVHPPIYFLVMRFFKYDSEFSLRLPTVLFGVISIALLMHLIVRFYRNYDFALWVGLLLAVNPYAIWHARTARPYGLVLLLGVIVSYYFLLVLNGKRSRLNWGLFIISSALLYCTHYYTAGIALAQYITMMFALRGDRRFYWMWVGAQAIAILPLFGWLYAIAQQEAIGIGIGWIPAVALKDIGLTFWNMTIGYEGNRYWFEPIGLAIATMGIIAGLVVAFRRFRDDITSLYFFWLVISPIVGVFIIALFRPLYVDRYFVYTTPGLIVLIVLGWQQLSTSKLYRLGALTILLGVAGLNFSLNLSQENYESENWRGAVTYILDHKMPDDQIVTATLLEFIPFSIYDDQSTELVAYEEGVFDQFEDSVSHVWIMYRYTKNDIHRQGYLKNTETPLTHVPDLAQWLEENEYRIDDYREFRGVTVIRVNLQEIEN